MGSKAGLAVMEKRVCRLDVPFFVRHRVNVKVFMVELIRI